jgi:hypothetical protein
VNSEPKLSSDFTQEDYHWIAESAYYKALARDFTPICDQDDWIEAQKEHVKVLSKQQRNGLVRIVPEKLL